MSSTPKALRTPPPRTFEDYTFVRVVARSEGLTHIPDSIMLPLDQDPSLIFIGLYNVSEGYSDDASSLPMPIGFDFEFDGVTYKQFFANTNGWLALIDPNQDLTAYEQMHDSLLLSGTTFTYRNQNIRTENTGSSAMLCPWFDDLRNVSDDPQKLAGYSSTNKNRIKQGLHPLPVELDGVAYGVKYYRENNSPYGRRLIVRWSSLSNYMSAASLVKFEVVLYENGLIEYRYAPRKSLSTTNSNEGATIGIFMSGSNRFRDFSIGLGYRDGERIVNVNGGATFSDNPTFEDDIGTAPASAIRPFVGNLNPNNNWPGQESVGATIAFTPPQNKRVVLPRLEQSQRSNKSVLPTIARTGDSRSGRSETIFDDRRSLNYLTGTTVSAPSMLQPLRFLGNADAGLRGRINLFPAGIEIEGSIEKTAVDQFLNPTGLDVEGTIDPYDESHRPDQSYNTLDDLFYISGSRADLNQSLRAKTQIRIALPINAVTDTLPTSSLYYYNRTTKSWNVPLNSITPATIASSTGSNSDLANFRQQAIGKKQPEDHRGFGPIGNLVCSGTSTPSVNGLGPTNTVDVLGTDVFINAPYSTQAAIEAIQRVYGNTVTVSQQYNASPDEVFKIPINQPFVLEKAVIEVPIAMGDKWFLDRTSTFAPSLFAEGGFGNPSIHDFGGPGITVSLFNQLKIGSNRRRDLIMSGVITHTFDNETEVGITPTAPWFSNFPQFHIFGYPAFGYPAAVVTASAGPNGNFFSGSVQVPMEAAISNGVLTSFQKDLTDLFFASENREEIRRFLKLEKLKLVSASTETPSSTDYLHTYNIAYINSFGRGNTGFAPSGRSIFGQEHSTSQVIVENGLINNPFYFSGSIPDELETDIAANNAFLVHTVLNLQKHERSPYVLFPGDELVLAISKTRPFFYGNQSASVGFDPGGYQPAHFNTLDRFAGLQHDVTLLTGTINITLYGSMLRELEEVSPGQNQLLASDAVHETIGSEPILDEYDIAYRDEFIGGVLDDYITGSLINVQLGRTIVFRTGSRGRVFSKFNARSQQPPDTSAAEIDVNPYKAFREQPWYEKVGNERFISMEDENERYLDSLMPDVYSILRADGNIIFGPNANNTFSSVGEEDKLSLFGTAQPQRQPYMVFNDRVNGDVTRHNITNWTWAFPFEPRYANAVRQKDFQTWETERIIDVGLSDFDNQQTARRWDNGFSEKGLVLGTSRARIDNESSLTSEKEYFWFADSNLSALNNFGFHPTGSMIAEDTMRVLFGFGDFNTYHSGVITSGTLNGQSIIHGTRNWPDFQNQEFSSIDNLDPLAVNVHNYCFKPIIRGWKYGVLSGLPTFSRMYFKRNRYGQLRDMLEQRPFARYFTGKINLKGPIEVRFVDSAGNTTNPENTSSQNLSLEATSSLPYFDGIERNRNPINQATQNTNLVSFGADEFNNLEVG